MILVCYGNPFMAGFILDTDDGTLESIPDEAVVRHEVIDIDGVLVSYKSMNECNWVCYPLDLAFINEVIYYNGKCVIPKSCGDYTYFTYSMEDKVLSLINNCYTVKIDLCHHKLVSGGCDEYNCTLQDFIRRFD